MNKLLYLLFICLAFSACKKEAVTKVPTLDHLKAETLKDVRYVTGTDKNQVMDIYLPADRSTATTKVIVLLHGGAWAEGDKSGSEDPHFKTLFDSIRLKYPDWAIFNLNYRLATLTSNHFPAQEADVKNAIQYIYDNRSKFAISDKWVYMGMSAGAHLALLQAYKNQAPIKPKAVVDFYGPTDMTALYDFFVKSGEEFVIKLLMNGSPSSNAALYNSSSPINFVGAQSPATIIFQGGEDDTVPFEQSKTLAEKLASNGVTYKYLFYKEQTHGWSDPAVWRDCFKNLDAFLIANVP